MNEIVYDETLQMGSTRYDWSKGQITIDYHPVSMRRAIEKGTYGYHLKTLLDMKKVDECVRKSINRIDNHQSTSEP